MSLVLSRLMDKAIQISGKKLAALRKLRYLTQEEVARELKVSKGRVSAIEAEDETGMYARNFVKLATLFKMTPEVLSQQLAVGDEVVSVQIPRETYNQINFFAKEANVSVPEMIAIRFSTEQTLLVNLPHPPDGASAPPPAIRKTPPGRGRARSAQGSRQGSRK